MDIKIREQKQHSWMLVELQAAQSWCPEGSLLGAGGWMAAPKFLLSCIPYPCDSGGLHKAAQHVKGQSWCSQCFKPQANAS